MIYKLFTYDGFNYEIMQLEPFENGLGYFNVHVILPYRFGIKMDINERLFSDVHEDILYTILSDSIASSYIKESNLKRYSKYIDPDYLDYAKTHVGKRV